MASNTEVGRAMSEMDKLSTRANALLEALVAARETEATASADATGARLALANLEKELEAARALVRSWAFTVYAGGGAHADLEGLLDALTNASDHVGDPLGDLNYLSEQHNEALATVTALTKEQRVLAASAGRSEAEAEAATARLRKDKAELDGLLKVQRTKVAHLREAQMAEVARAGPVAGLLVGARSPAAQAAAERLRSAIKGASAEVGDIGKPCTTSSADFPNGLFPAGALCPLWGAPGERLAPRAAAAFNALSQAYAAQTGTPLCVTDSYRSLSEQYAVKASRGAWAATPGTSPHGRGIALDLCGGINSFGTTAHLWMKQNAPLYGWYHPSWAGPTGSLPEPWHWEFAG